MKSDRTAEKDGRHVLEPGGAEQHELVDARWLIKAGLLSLVGAIVLAYAAFCLLFYQGQWQIVLHPAPMLKLTANALPPHEDVRFGDTDSGQPALFGWWIPADPGARMESDVLLYLPSGSDSLSSRTATLTVWHQQRINVFAFDYRGYGNSAKLHPDEKSIKQDALSAVRYLTDIRHIPASHIVLFGESLGSLPAAYAAGTDTAIAGVILSNPEMSQLPLFQADPRTHLLPLRTLLRDQYSLADELPGLHQPTLVISSFGTQESAKDAKEVYAALSGQKSLLVLPPGASGGPSKGLLEGVAKFLDDTLHTGVASSANVSASASAATPAGQENATAPSARPGK